MRWSERQRAMLAEMGLRPWFRDDGGVATVEELPAASVGSNGDAVTTPAITPATTPAKAPAPAAPAPSPATSAPASEAVSAVSTEAAWLIVDGPTESVDVASRAAAEAEQAMLLVHMLRSIGVSPQAGTAAARSMQVRTGTPALDDPDRLREQIRPRCVLVLGRAPALALLGIDEPLGRLRGRVHAWRGIPVVVTFSLAYLLRHPGDKAKAWLDLCLAATAIDAPAPA